MKIKYDDYIDVNKICIVHLIFVLFTVFRRRFHWTNCIGCLNSNLKNELLRYDVKELNPYKI